jgi:hypothetical protein
MEELDEYRQDLISALEAAIDGLSSRVAGASAQAWHVPIDPNWRTPHYVLSRLQALETQLFATQLPRILNEDTPDLPLFDVDGWLAGNYDPETPAQTILEELAAQRQREVEWLRGLPLESWSRAARHPWWGLRTFQWWVELQLDYSRQHLSELGSSLAM